MTPDPELVEILKGVVTKAPRWLRDDLLSKDDKVRLNAEETLATLMANALQAVNGG